MLSKNLCKVQHSELVCNAVKMTFIKKSTNSPKMKL